MRLDDCSSGFNRRITRNRQSQGSWFTAGFQWADQELDLCAQLRGTQAGSGVVAEDEGQEVQEEVTGGAAGESSEEGSSSEEEGVMQHCLPQGGFTVKAGHMVAYNDYSGVPRRAVHQVSRVQYDPTDGEYCLILAGGGALQQEAMGGMIPDQLLAVQDELAPLNAGGERFWCAKWSQFRFEETDTTAARRQTKQLQKQAGQLAQAYHAAEGCVYAGIRMLQGEGGAKVVEVHEQEAEQAAAEAGAQEQGQQLGKQELPPAGAAAADAGARAVADWSPTRAGQGMYGDHGTPNMSKRIFTLDSRSSCVAATPPAARGASPIEPAQQQSQRATVTRSRASSKGGSRAR
jgi:hypothetical protein